MPSKTKLRSKTYEKTERAIALSLILIFVVMILASPRLVANYSSASSSNSESANTQFQIPSLIPIFNSSTVLVTYKVTGNPIVYNEPLKLTVSVEIPMYWTFEAKYVDVSVEVPNAVDSLAGDPVSLLPLWGPFNDSINVVDQLYTNSEIVNFTTSGDVSGYITIGVWPNQNITGNWQYKSWTFYNTTSLPIQQQVQLQPLNSQPNQVSSPQNNQNIWNQIWTFINEFWQLIGSISVIVGLLASVFYLREYRSKKSEKEFDAQKQSKN